MKPLNQKNPFERNGGKDNYPPFAKILMDARIDFSKETLIVLCRSEPSGSIRLWFWLGEESDGTLTGRITRECPPAQTTDIKNWCFAFALSKERPRKLVLWEQQLLEVIDVPAK